MQIQIPADFKRPPFPKKEGAAFAYNAFLSFSFYLNAFWFFHNILKFELYKSEIYAASPTGYLSPSVTIHLDEIYRQLDDFLQNVTAEKISPLKNRLQKHIRKTRSKTETILKIFLFQREIPFPVSWSTSEKILHEYRQIPSSTKTCGTQQSKNMIK